MPSKVDENSKARPSEIEGHSRSQKGELRERAVHANASSLGERGRKSKRSEIETNTHGSKDPVPVDLAVVVAEEGWILGVT